MSSLSFGLDYRLSLEWWINRRLLFKRDGKERVGVSTPLFRLSLFDVEAGLVQGGLSGGDKDRSGVKSDPGKF